MNKQLINDIISQVKIGTLCKMETRIYEVVKIYPYSDECSLPLYKMIVIDNKSIEILKQQLIRDKKRSKYTEDYTEEELLQYRTIEDIEPFWFIERNATIIKSQ